MFRNCLKCLLLILCSWLLVGPQFFLQLGAWSWMIANYSQESSLRVAIQETFSGERPCGMCKAIQESESNNSNLPANANPSAEELRLLPLPLISLKLAPDESADSRSALQMQNAVSRCAKVPTPPPKHQA